jgi:hypothetical protein
MADFSKQWCEINDPEMPHDFDILEEAAKCKPNYSISYICEGFGFIAIGRDEEGEVVLAMPNYEDNTMTWKPYNEIVK